MAAAEALSAARALLPAWAAWLPLLSVAFATALAAALAALAVLLAGGDLRRLTPASHWTERARALAPVRRAVAVVAGVDLVLSASLVVDSPLSAVPGRLAWALGLALPFAAVVAVGFAVEDREARRIPLRARLRSLATWSVVMGGGFLLGLASAGVGGAQDWGWGATGAVLVGIAAHALGGGLAVGRWLGLVRPAPEVAGRAMAAAAASLGRAPAPVFALGLASANAFAFPLAGRVGVTEGALEALGEPELAAIFAHELEHLDEPRAVRWARAATAMALPGAIALLPAAWRLGREVGALAVLLGLLLWIVLFARLSRRLEAHADQAGALAGATYARALETVYRYNLAPALSGRRAASHSDLVDRLAAAGVTPDWPRPAAPRRARWSLLMVVVLVVGAVTWVTSWRREVQTLDPDDPAALALRAVVAGDPWALASLGHLHWARQDLGPAATFLLAAEALAPDLPNFPVTTALVLTAAGRCEEAAAALARAERLGPPRWKRSAAEPEEGEEAEGDWLASTRVVVGSCRAAP